MPSEQQGKSSRSGRGVIVSYQLSLFVERERNGRPHINTVTLHIA